MNLVNVYGLAIGAWLLIGPLANAADANDAAFKKTLDNCAVCHGINGQSVSPTFPNLAAQQSHYIEQQLKAFKDQSRGDPDAQAYMWGMASQLSDGMITQLANYFSAQPAPPGHTGDTTLIAEGKKLFTAGRAIARHTAVRQLPRPRRGRAARRFRVSPDNMLRTC